MRSTTQAEWAISIDMGKCPHTDIQQLHYIVTPLGYFSLRGFLSVHYKVLYLLMLHEIVFLRERAGFIPLSPFYLKANLLSHISTFLPSYLRGVAVFAF